MYFIDAVIAYAAKFDEHKLKSLISRLFISTNYILLF